MCRPHRAFLTDDRLDACGRTRGVAPTVDWFAVVLQHEQAIRDRCRLLMKDGEDAKEAFSRTIFRAVLKLPVYGAAIADTRAWVLTLTYRVCIDLHRERNRLRQEALDPDAGDPPGLAAGVALDPERAALEKELHALLYSAIGGLPYRLRCAMRLYLWTGSYRDVAERLGITEVNARKRVQQARAILRASLDDYRVGRAG